MTPTRLVTVLVLGLLAASALALGDERLSVGDPAPALSIEHFVKGERVDGFPPGKVTVVEFWATWCKPCIANFPHLSELQDEHPDELLIIGVSDEPLATVEPFLAKPEMAARTRYTLATDPDGSMQRDWMGAARQRGIPCAFIVDREGIIRYIGHPAAMDRTLQRVLTGSEPAASTPRAAINLRALRRVNGEHSADAREHLEALRDRLARPDATLHFTQEVLLAGALRMGGPDGPAMDLSKTREGTLVLTADRGDRLDATRTMHIPGMPGGMGESESALFDGDTILVRSRNDSSFAMGSGMPDGWTTISRDEAGELFDEALMPLPMALVMQLSPALLNPLDALDWLVAMSALEVVLDEDGQIVLEGPAAQLAGVPSMPEPGADGERSLEPRHGRLRIRFSPFGGPVTLAVGDLDAPSLTMTIEREPATEAPADELFDIGEAEPQPLAPLLREQREAMAAMAAEMGDGR